ncbi:hypothetical protein EDC45_1003 [Mesocricetibacter intestinalis]|uniref:Outer membrane protein with beta-barrel domain n=1 Tax=Mesocricetibacter intestinalis TaxID=1521930 RepID=A0A4R6VBZ2_9PAST|nr:hypothetical protein [Mesocricetibacter intestinalis]TDQ57936.1 hypothetical protein EDC45_1003 [Mesocricetibacter intestinalis]
MKTKSLVLTTFLLFPLLAGAQSGGFNFYTKAGIDLTSRFETLQIPTEENELFPAPAGSKKNTFSPSIFLETTYNIFPQTELGLGMGYIKRKGFLYQGSIVERGQVETESYKVNRYSSVPLYVTLKQNYALNRNMGLYFKTDLGYSLNKTADTAYRLYQNNIKQFERPIKFKTKDGFYLGLVIGIEYKSLLAELGYYHSNSALSYEQHNPRQRITHSHNSSYNNDALRFSIGFKF